MSDLSDITGLSPARGPDCASDLTLDQHSRRELSEEQAREIDLHIEGCERCRARSKALEASSVSGEARERIIRGIQQGLESGRSDDKVVPLFGQRWKKLVPVLAAAAASITFVVLVRPQNPEETRSKGSLGLTVYRASGAGPVRLKSGARLSAKDRLQFAVDIPKAGHMMIVGVEADRSMYACIPNDGSDASLPVEQTRKTKLLEQAVELDESQGREELMLVLCDSPFDLDSLRAAGDGRGLPEGCTGTSFEMNKGP